MNLQDFWLQKLSSEQGSNKEVASGLQNRMEKTSETGPDPRGLKDAARWLEVNKESTSGMENKIGAASVQENSSILLENSSNRLGNHKEVAIGVEEEVLDDFAMWWKITTKKIVGAHNLNILRERMEKEKLEVMRKLEERKKPEKAGEVAVETKTIVTIPTKKLPTQNNKKDLPDDFLNSRPLFSRHPTYD